MYKWAEMMMELGGGSLTVELAQNGWAATVTVYTDDGEDHLIHGGCPYGESQLQTLMERLGERLEAYIQTGIAVDYEQEKSPA